MIVWILPQGVGAAQGPLPYSRYSSGLPPKRKKAMRNRRIGHPHFHVAPQQKAAQCPHQIPSGPKPRLKPKWIATMLQGKSALVTGSTSGIGLAIARAFA